MASDIVTINTPDEPTFEITAVNETEVVFVEDLQQRQWPSARVFEDLGDAETTLVAMSPALVCDELESAVDEAIDAVQRAKHVAADMRADAYDSKFGRSELLMGNLHQLPEVGQSLDPNRRNMSCPWCREDENTYEDEEYRLHCFECGESYDAIDRRELQDRAAGNQMISEAAADV